LLVPAWVLALSLHILSVSFRQDPPSAALAADTLQNADRDTD
jgi:hypothetical protein